MATARLFNLARMTTATPGTGTVTLGSAVTGFLTFAQAGVTDGATVTYAIKDGNNSEIGRGVYTSSGTTLSRATILNSTNSNNALNLTGSAEVFITPSAEDFLTAVNAQTGTSYTVLATDFGKMVTLTNSLAIAVTLPQATGLFPAGWYCCIVNIGSSTATITPTTSTINGAATLTLNRGQGVYIASDGTNWQVLQGTGLKGATSTVASASTADIGTVASDRVSVTGTTTITSFGTVPNVIRFVSFTGVLTLTHNGTSLILPGSSNIVTAAGDCAIFSSDSSGNWRCLNYSKADGTAIGSAFATIAEVQGTHTTGTVTSGTASLTVGSATGITAGMFVVGEGITPGTTVSSIVSTTVTLSANANATLSSDPVSFYVANKSTSPGTLAGQLCRAWVNFNGTSTVAIRSAYNVSSITDNGTGDYTINFTTALPDSNYSAVVTSGGWGAAYNYSGTYVGNVDTPTTTALRIAVRTGATLDDQPAVCVAIFR